MYNMGITVYDNVFYASKLQKGRSLNVLIIKKKQKLMESCDMMEVLAYLSG